MKKNNKWIKPRHTIITAVIRPILHLYMKVSYGVKIEKFRQQGRRQYLILMNHQTAFDQFFVAVSFKRPVYYIASEDIFSLGWKSSLIRYLASPIPIKKQTMDIQAVKSCLKVAKEGGTIALAPEGNRTYSGKTEYIKPGIISLIKKLKLPVAIYRIEGGYGVKPRWSDVTRKGYMRSYVDEVIEPETYSKISNDELYKMICDKLYVDETKLSHEYYHRKSAEYLERAIYVCPDCGFSTFRSENSYMKCLKCGLEIEYLPTKKLMPVKGKMEFEFVKDWYEYQQQYINGLNIAELIAKVNYCETVELWEIMVYKNRIKLSDSLEIVLKGDRIVLGNNREFLFDDIDAVTILGKNKVNIYYKDKVYQVLGDKGFNGLKYVNIFNRYKNIIEGEENVEFLGL